MSCCNSSSLLSKKSLKDSKYSHIPAIIASPYLTQTDIKNLEHILCSVSILPESLSNVARLTSSPCLLLTKYAMYGDLLLYSSLRLLTSLPQPSYMKEVTLPTKLIKPTWSN